MFLTADELTELTGYMLTSYQVKWLDRHGYAFELSKAGRPKVLRAYVEKRLGLPTVAPVRQAEPDFSRWEGRD